MNQGGGGGNNKGLENFALGAIGVLLVISVVFYGAGYVGARLFHGVIPTATIGDAPSILFKIFGNPTDPRAAWPVADQAAVPGVVGYYFILLVMIALIVGIGLTVYRLFQDSGSRNGLGGKGTSWASRGDIKSLIVKGPEPGRLIMGKVGGATVATEQRHSVIVLGPTQSGKTTGLAVPSILEWSGPVIATSVKNDLAQDTLGWRERMGSVWVYDPMATTGLPASTWSPLDGAREWSGAKRIAAWLTGASKTGSKMSGGDGDFWYAAAGKLLAPHLFAAAANGYTMADVVRWIDTQEEFEVRSLLQATGEDDAIRAADASWQREDRARSSIYTTAEVVIEAFADPTVQQSARSSEIATSKFYDGGHHTLYVCAPSHEQDRLRPVFSTLMKQFIRAAYDFGKRLDPPLLIVLDEAANIAPLDDLDSIASTCSGLGIQLVSVWQDMAQIKSRYSDRANTVVNNHRAKIVLSGISDTDTLDYVSRLIGSEEVSSESSTVDGQGSKSRTMSKSDKSLAPADVVRRIKINEGVLIYGAFQPARLRLRPWYNNKRLTAMVKNQVPVDVPREDDNGNDGGGAPMRSDNGSESRRQYEDYQRSSPIG